MFDIDFLSDISFIPMHEAVSCQRVAISNIRSMSGQTREFCVKSLKQELKVFVVMGSRAVEVMMKNSTHHGSEVFCSALPYAC